MATPASRSSIVMGGLFVVCLVLLLFLLNGDAVVLTWISTSLGQYQSIVEQLLAYCAVGGFAVIAIKSEGIKGKEIGLTLHKFVLSLPVLSALGISTIAIAWLGNRLPQFSMSTQSGVSLPLPAVIFIVLVIAAIEEYIFRGYVQVGTRKHFGVMAGLVVSSAVFALAHIPSDISIANPTSIGALYALIPTLVLSAFGRFAFGIMAFAVMYQLTGNIFITIFIHAFYDFTVVYYTPVGGNLSIVFVCLFLPYLVVGLESLTMGRKKVPALEKPLAPKL